MPSTHTISTVHTIATSHQHCPYLHCMPSVQCAFECCSANLAPEFRAQTRAQIRAQKPAPKLFEDVELSSPKERPNFAPKSAPKCTPKFAPKSRAKIFWGMSRAISPRQNSAPKSGLHFQPPESNSVQSIRGPIRSINSAPNSVHQSPPLPSPPLPFLPSPPPPPFLPLPFPLPPPLPFPTFPFPLPPLPSLPLPFPLRRRSPPSALLPPLASELLGLSALQGTHPSHLATNVFGNKHSRHEHSRLNSVIENTIDTPRTMGMKTRGPAINMYVRFPPNSATTDFGQTPNLAPGDWLP